MVVDSSVRKLNELRDTIEGVSFDTPCFTAKWDWVVEPVYTKGSGRLKGWLIRPTFQELSMKSASCSDHYEFVPVGASKSDAVQAAWLCLDLAIRRELLRTFQHNGSKVFDSHRMVDEIRPSTFVGSR